MGIKRYADPRWRSISAPFMPSVALRYQRTGGEDGGNGNGNGEFEDPSDLAGLVLWFRGDAAYTDANKTDLCDEDAEAVYTLDDKSDTDADLTQATLENRPAYKPDRVNSVPGADSLAFGTGDYICSVGGDITADFGTPFDVYAVVMIPEVVGNGDTILDGSSEGVGTCRLFFQNAGNHCIQGSDTNGPYTYLVHEGKYRLIQLSVDASNNMTMRVNGIGKDTKTNSSEAPKGLTLGDDGGLTTDCICEVAEVVCCTGVLEDSDRESLESYFNDRYSLWTAGDNTAEDLTDEAWVEADGADYLAVNDTRLTVTSIPNDEGNSYLSKDFGSGYFGMDTVIDFDFCITSIDSEAGAADQYPIIALQAGPPNSLSVGGGYAAVFVERVDDDTIEINVGNYGVSYTYDTFDYTPGSTVFYCRLYRVGTGIEAGEGGTYISVYSDANRTTLMADAAANTYPEYGEQDVPNAAATATPDYLTLAPSYSTGGSTKPISFWIDNVKVVRH
jgi:hypothetical protein